MRGVDPALATVAAQLPGLHLGNRTRRYVAILQRDPCCYCGERTDGPASVDHIQPENPPVGPPGPSNWTNYTAACKSCNRDKGNAGLLHFLCASGKVQPCSDEMRW
jgi:5-methylcytosine-specific restriction endonuclease McrA